MPGAPRFRLFGGVRVADRAGHDVPVGAAKRQLVLAALLLDAGRLVTVDALVCRVWGDDPPAHADGVLRAHLSRIRGGVLDLLRADGAGPALVHRAGGYVLEVDPDDVDVHRFRALAAEAGETGDDGRRAELLGRARELWTGDPLAGLAGVWVEETAELLRRDHVAATVAWAGALLRTGRGDTVVAALGDLVERDRFDEVLAARYLEALAASGRGAQALAAYGRIRDHLLAELGSEPGPELRAVHLSLLGPAADRDRDRERGGPAQLPPAARPFRGRDAELTALAKARAGAAPAVVLTGPGGVGKTALAVHWAWSRRDEFPDGQLYVDLRGPDAESVPAAGVLERFLRALGVPADEVPPEPDERAALYRSRLAGRRVLVLLDNAGSSAQVRPLLPGSPGCLTLVTSRHGLDGLVARDGAERLPVATLDPAESVELLAAMVGDDGSLPELAGLCGGLPLALRIAAARLTAERAPTVAALVAELAGEHPLRGLAVEQGDAAVAGAFATSYRALPSVAARAFRLLGLVPATGDGLGPPATAALLGAGEPAARQALGVLADAHLVTPRPGGRHDMHDLIHLYARDRAVADESAEAADEALRRLLGWYVRTCDAADQVLSRGRAYLTRPDAARGADGTFADEAAALAWFQAEGSTVRVLSAVAAGRGWDDATWQLAESQVEVLQREHRLDELLAVSGAGAAAAHRAGNPTAEAALTSSGGIACALAGRFDDAVDRMDRAAELHLRNGNPRGAGMARMNVGSARSDQGRYGEALVAFRAALDLLENAGHAGGVGICLGNLGELHRRLGEHAEAERYLRRALDVGVERGSERDQAVALENLAELLTATGRRDEALAGFDRALAVARAAGDRLTEGRALAGRGDVLDGPAAVSAWQEALAVLESIGSPEAAGIRERLLG